MMTRTEIEEAAAAVAGELWITPTRIEFDFVLDTLRIDVPAGYTEEQRVDLASAVSFRIPFVHTVQVRVA